jgi:hypothetical protein
MDIMSLLLLPSRFATTEVIRGNREDGRTAKRADCDARFFRNGGKRPIRKIKCVLLRLFGRRQTFVLPALGTLLPTPRILDGLWVCSNGRAMTGPTAFPVFSMALPVSWTACFAPSSGLSGMGRSNGW